jgi:DNA-binding transcriptional LysR family regulator
MMRDVDTAALRCFVTAVRAGSMGRAAEVLGRTQPAITSRFAD